VKADGYVDGLNINGTNVVKLIFISLGLYHDGQLEKLTGIFTSESGGMLVFLFLIW
jgi:hypothetical protein